MQLIREGGTADSAVSHVMRDALITKLTGLPAKITGTAAAVRQLLVALGAAADPRTPAEAALLPQWLAALADRADAPLGEPQAPVNHTEEERNTLLAKVTFHPFGDFLLHDMGGLGDGITDGVAGPTMMRTMPLWGVHLRQAFLHDQRAGDLPTAITMHTGQGQAAADAFGALSADDQQHLIDLLMTL